MIHCLKCNYICDDKMFSCPNCRTAISESDNKRTAQFGGIGPTYNPGSPGAPGYLKNMGGGGIAQKAVDVGLDAIMGRTRSQEPDELPERNIETRLEPFHAYIEEDQIPYNLSFKERQELKIRKELQRRRKNQELSDKSIYENSPAYIKEHYHPKPEEVTPLDKLLDQVRTNEEERIPSSEDKVLILDSEGKQRVASVKMATPKVGPTTTVFDQHGDTDDESDDLGTESHRPHSTIWDGFINHTPVVFTQTDYDQYLGKQGEEFADWTAEKGKKLMDYPAADEVELGGMPEKTSPPSAIQKPEQSIQNNSSTPTQSPISTNMTMEQQLEQTKYPKSQHLPQDLIPAYDWDRIRGEHGTHEGQGKEPYGVADRYTDVSNGFFHFPGV